MENFTFHLPTTLHFGKDVCRDLPQVLSAFGKRVLLITGQGSVKRSGLYETLVGLLKGFEVTEYAGIRSNPVVEDVDKAVVLGSGVDVILAVGGGSVIDSAKIISLCLPGSFKAWDVMTRSVNPSASVPLVAVLTLAATGSETNPFAVLQNASARRKTGFGHSMAYPRHAFLDPAYTLSVPANYTSYGITDLIAHCLEAFFGKGDSPLTDRITASIIAEALEAGPHLMHNLGDYTLRERIMWAATLALNGLTLTGRSSGDWGVHDLGHSLSFLYDVPHGASLSIAYPAWLRLHADRCPRRIEALGRMLWNTSDVDTTIRNLESFFRNIGSPVTLAEAGIGPDKHQEIVDLMTTNHVSGAHFKLQPADYSTLVALMAGQ